MCDIPAFASPISMFALARPSGRHLSLLASFRRDLRCASTTIALQVSPSTTPAASPSPSAAASCLRVYDACGGVIPYDIGWKWQHALVNELKRDSSRTMSDALILLEHPPVYTLGTRSDVRHVLFDTNSGSGICTPDVSGAELVRTERGGEVTYHGPGQLVFYAIVNLSREPFKKDLHWYLRKLEDVVITLLRDKYGIASRRIHGKTGVWCQVNNGNNNITEEKKIAAIGLKVSQWITMHGVALNVDADLRPFERIVPCGIGDGQVTSLKDILGTRTPPMETVKSDLVEVFQQVFRIEKIRHRADAKYMGEAVPW